MKSFIKSKAGIITVAAVAVVAIAAVILAIVLYPEAYRTIVAVQVEGTATVSNSKSENVAVYDNMNLYSGDSMTVADNSWVTLKLDGDKHVLAEENTKLRLEATGSAGSDRTVIHLEQGSALIRIENRKSESRSYEVHTPNSVISVRGTVFRVSVPEKAESKSLVRVETFDGEVSVTPENDEFTETDGVELFKLGESATVDGNGELSKFVRGSAGEVHGAIDYGTLPAKVVEALIDYFDDGETLSVDKDYLTSLLTPSEEQPHKHSGGTATCIKRAVCEICGEEYGELAEHEYDKAWQGDTENHWKKCIHCGEEAEHENHSESTADGENSVCDICAVEYGETAEHKFSDEWLSDGKNHWHKCEDCNVISDISTHTGGTAACTERAKCSVCGTEYGKLYEHTFSTEWASNGSSHWHECTVCGEISGSSSHTGGTATCTASAKCSICGAAYGEPKEHTYTMMSYDGGHWQVCTVCNAATNKSGHSGGAATCSYVYAEATGHISLGMSYNDTGHYQIYQSCEDFFNMQGHNLVELET